MGQSVDRRAFLGSAAALSLTAAGYGRVAGANERLGVAMLGCGGRAQAHLDILNRWRAAGEPVAVVAVCDVWDGHEDEYVVTFGGQRTRRRYVRGLYPAARKCGLDPDDRRHVVKDYRRLLELPEVDIVCIATPDHWHARMTLDALAAGKDVFVERPMTRRVEEAAAVLAAWRHSGRVVTVGVTSMADPVWLQVWDYLRQGHIGQVIQGQTGAFCNDLRGQWRFYRLVESMTPQTIDWGMFLGHQFEAAGRPLGPSPREMPFDRAAFAQWRCLAAFSGGPLSDRLSTPVTRMLAAMGVRWPGRVCAGGGLMFEYDGRTVPDVATIVADFDAGCQLLAVATTVSHYPIEEVIRGRLGSIRLVRGGFEVYRDDPGRGSPFPERLEGPLRPEERLLAEPPPNETEALWRQFVECVQQRRPSTYCPPDLGAAAVAVTALAEESLRCGQALRWDAARGEIVPVGSEWLAEQQQRSRNRARPPHIFGWSGGDSGRTLQPPDHQHLAAPWRDAAAESGT